MALQRVPAQPAPSRPADTADTADPAASAGRTDPAGVQDAPTIALDTGAGADPAADGGGDQLGTGGFVVGPKGSNRQVSWHLPSTGPIPVKPGELTSHRGRKVMKRTLSKIWDDSIFGWSAQCGFWCAMSTAPLLLALLGMSGYVAGWFGTDTINKIEDQVNRALQTVFSPEVFDNLLRDNVSNLLHNGRADVVSVGFLISLWAGSSAMSAFVEAITIAYCQHEVRHPAVERFFALGLYLVGLVCGIVLLPLAAIGPSTLINLFPDDVHDTVSTIINIAYYPTLGVVLVILVTTLYKVAPKHKHPWRRGLPGAVLAAAVFLVTSTGLRIYVSYVSTHGLSYGALTVPVVYLLFYYFVSMSIISGAQFNNALLEYFPPKRSRRAMRRWRQLAAGSGADGGSAGAGGAGAERTPEPSTSA